MRPLSGHILVVGLGVSGSAVVRYLVNRIAQGDPLTVTAVDSADTPELRATASALAQSGVEVLLGTSNVQGAYDLAVVSPGVPPHVPLMTSVQGVAKEVIGELEFAFRLSVSPWIAVTGTNGKTTTTTLITHLLGYAGIAAESAGNIGHPAIEVATKTGPGTAIVAEVSSFQLSLTERFHPRVSVLLNITPDHIDWHGSMEAYVGDKARVFANQDADDSAVIDA
ncbi:MAG: Mur ligase family protein, partial [Coriobacteriia bacterium]|nr:Mur ligase family protein [Coriobacteriia bacterium]